MDYRIKEILNTGPMGWDISVDVGGPYGSLTAAWHAISNKVSLLFKDPPVRCHYVIVRQSDDRRQEVKIADIYMWDCPAFFNPSPELPF